MLMDCCWVLLLDYIKGKISIAQGHLGMILPTSLLLLNRVLSNSFCELADSLDSAGGGLSMALISTRLL